ncbi:hypothetical protein D3C71_1505260 [compost metagenome]
MNAGEADLGARQGEYFNGSVMESGFALGRYIVIDISDRAVRVGHDQDVRSECRFGVVAQVDRLQRRIDDYIFGNIEEYASVPQCRMQRRYRMLIRLDRGVQITLDQVAVLAGCGLQIREDHALGGQLGSKIRIHRARVALDDQTASFGTRKRG